MPLSPAVTLVPFGCEGRLSVLPLQGQKQSSEGFQWVNTSLSSS